MVAPDIQTTLMWNGIVPPKEGFRTTCPQCAPHRKRKNHRALKFWQKNGSVEWLCAHCGWKGSDT